jgi:hypothetical protein
MAILVTGNTYAANDQVTSTNLNAAVNGATFASGAVDNVSTTFSSGSIIVKDSGVSPQKLDSAASYTMGSLTAASLIGNLTGNASTATNVAYSGLTGTVPTWNQNTTGTAANVTGTVAIANGGTGATTAAGALTNLGATTVGANFLTLPNPSAIRFLRLNADNTVSPLSDADFRVAIGAGSGGGSVTSVGISGGSTGLTVTGSPITTSGTITLQGTLALASGGTGATDAAGARSAFSVPSSTGTGASGTWAIGITGNAATATTATTAGNVSGTVALANGGTGATTAPGARSALGLGTAAVQNSTTVGANLLNLTNPSAIRFLRINSDNTATALTDSAFVTAIGAYSASNPSSYISGGIGVLNNALLRTRNVAPFFIPVVSPTIVEIDDSGNCDGMQNFTFSGVANASNGANYYAVAGNRVVGARQAAEPDVSTTSSLVGSDTVERSVLLASINALETTINNLLAKLRTHGLIAS